MTLGELIAQLPPGLLTPVNAGASLNLALEAVLYNSRMARPGTIFVAMRGEKADGHAFLHQASATGATVVGEDEAALRACGGAAFITENARRAVAILSDTFYHHPSRELDVVGVTGTNGKTTTVHLIERLYAGLGYKTGRIGTLGVKIGETEEEGTHTTPEAPDLQGALRQMADAGVQKVAMEVSSHALAQDRAWGTAFSTVVFTNLTQDHLDYHHDMDSYRAAKRRLFLEYGRNRMAGDHGDCWRVLNLDDPEGQWLFENGPDSAISYGLSNPANPERDQRMLCASDIRPAPGGTSFRLRYCHTDREVQLRLPGVFNVYNALAALGAVFACDELKSADWERAVDILQTLTGAPGRFEAVDGGQDFAVLVDYAHTPDALENILRAARQITPIGRVLTVFGCGGDRDRTKRPIMGRIATELSDLVFVTSDNPRTEEPNAIIAEIEAGLSGTANYTKTPDRSAAIHAAIAEARTGDTVVIAGKGHEDYQILGTVKHHFDDREVAREALLARRGGR